MLASVVEENEVKGMKQTTLAEINKRFQFAENDGLTRPQTTKFSVRSLSWEELLKRRSDTGKAKEKRRKEREKKNNRII